MLKWLLFIVGGALFYLWLKGKQQKRTHAERQKPIQAKPSSPLKTQSIVQCQQCQVHLPLSEAIVHEDRFYCSEEHLYSLDQQGWLGSALWRRSPNQDARPDGQLPELVVLHHISLPPGEFVKRASTQFIIDFFQNKLDRTFPPYFEEIADQQVSSHFLIARSGKVIQFVSTRDKAWHAGQSSFMGREKCNDFSIGIELEGDADHPFEEIQYKVLAGLSTQLQDSYPHLRFVGHSDIAPGRKTDPGKQFDWEKFQVQANIPTEQFPNGLGRR